MNEPMKDFTDERWTKLVKSFRDRVDEDKKYFNCWSTYVKLPEICPQPKYCLIGMEPGPGNDREEPEYRNFVANKRDFLIHYSAYHYLGAEGFNYQMTDMAKGGILIDDAGRTQSERYRIWLPLLKQELELLGNPKVIFIGKGLYDLNARESYLPVSNGRYICHVAGSANGHVATYYQSIKNIHDYDPPSDVKGKIRELAEELIKMHNYSKELKGDILGSFNEELAEIDKKRLAVYRYDFERFSKSP
jgi:hypothetical protein